MSCDFFLTFLARLTFFLYLCAVIKTLDTHMKRIILLLALCASIATTYAQQLGATNVGVMLPLHNVDGDGRRMLEYYRGILMAVDKLKQEGKNVNVMAWNVPIDADPRTTLLENGATNCQVIFGPLYTKQVKAIGDFCKAYNIKMVIPFSISGNDVDKNPQIYQVYQNGDELNTAAIQRVVENFADRHVVIIDCNDTTSRKGTFTFALRKILESKGRAYHITNLNSSDEQFVKAFSLSQSNLVILNTGRMPELRQAIEKLDAMRQRNTAVSCTLFGYTEWLMYAKYLPQQFARYDAYVPTTFYYNEASAATQQFAQKYRQNFGDDMMPSLPHFALTGYDHAMYFVGSRGQWLQSPLNFVKTSTNGGYRNRTFMLIHYKNNGGIEALSY